MKLKTKTLSLIFILIALCACSTTPPMVVHDEYGEMTAENPVFQAEAKECALNARYGVSGATLNKNSEKQDLILASIELVSFFSDNASCIKSKGWRLKE